MFEFFIFFHVPCFCYIYLFMFCFSYIYLFIMSEWTEVRYGRRRRHSPRGYGPRPPSPGEDRWRSPRRARRPRSPPENRRPYSPSRYGRPGSPSRDGRPFHPRRAGPHRPPSRGWRPPSPPRPRRPFRGTGEGYRRRGSPPASLSPPRGPRPRSPSPERGPHFPPSRDRRPNNRSRGQDRWELEGRMARAPPLRYRGDYRCQISPHRLENISSSKPASLSGTMLQSSPYGEEIFIPVINMSEDLPRQTIAKIKTLNYLIKDTGRQIPRLERESSTEADNIHWTPRTAHLMWQAWKAFLNQDKEVINLSSHLSFRDPDQTPQEGSLLRPHLECCQEQTLVPPQNKAARLFRPLQTPANQIILNRTKTNYPHKCCP